MARCSQCGAEANPSVTFCPSCGKKFVPVADPVQAGEDGLYYCFRHKKVTTRVTCGRCGKPICDRCMIVGANGVRCLECAKQNIPISINGVLHDISRSIGRLGQSVGSRGIWYLFIGGFLIRLLFGFGCHR